MKRIAIISLALVFLTSTYSYATLSEEEILQAMEKIGQQQLTQEEGQELFIELISTVDFEQIMSGDLRTIESILPNQSTECVLLIILSFIFIGSALGAMLVVLFSYLCV